ncbi:MAG: hypothetical protein GVY15_10610 [Bacteroidetes bacterium]|jgi:CrcB protein|nr:hypothetical protein [Bacteroidota bacterium]
MLLADPLHPVASHHFIATTDYGRGQSLLYVALGSAAGGGLRHAVALFTGAARSAAWSAAWSSAYPVATRFVNVAGSPTIRGIAGWLRSSTRRRRWTCVHLLGMTGLCGGSTTFAVFSSDTWAVLASGAFGTAMGCVSLSVALSLTAIWAGGTGAARYFLRRRSPLAT